MLFSDLQALCVSTRSFSPQQAPSQLRAEALLDVGPHLGEGIAGWTHLSSLAASMAMGDALAIAVSAASGFTKDDVARCHPGGSFGKEP
jgi:arabinose-5-phosphate isomerase